MTDHNNDVSDVMIQTNDGPLVPLDEFPKAELKPCENETYDENDGGDIGGKKQYVRILVKVDKGKNDIDILSTCVKLTGQDVKILTGDSKENNEEEDNESAYSDANFDAENNSSNESTEINNVVEKVTKSSKGRKRKAKVSNNFPGSPSKRSGAGKTLKIECEYCDKVFNHGANYKRHLQSHTGERPYLCGHCDKLFARKTSLEDHLKMHTGVKSCVCQFCGNNFFTKKSLNKHIQDSHSSELPEDDYQYQCKVCHRRFKNKGATVSHEKSHETTKKITKPGPSSGKEEKKREIYSCKYCDKTYMQKETLKSHINVIHLGIIEHACLTCDKVFRRGKELKEHIETVHSTTREFKHICHICGRSFYTNAYLKKHMVRHSDKKNFSCPLCSSMFKRKLSLNIHIKKYHTGTKVVHSNKSDDTGVSVINVPMSNEESNATKATKQKSYPCTLCEKEYKNKSHYRTHMKWHNGIYKFCCATCGVGYGKKGALQIHESEVHATEKTLPCLYPGCKNLFATDKGRQHHIYDVHRDYDNPKAKFSCDGQCKNKDCKKKFVTLANIRRHLIANKPDDDLNINESDSDPLYFCEMCEVKLHGEDKLREHLDEKHRQ